MDTPPPVYDPRPELAQRQGQWMVEGFRCRRCDYPMSYSTLACPLCGGELQPASFGPNGTVSASTCVRVRVPGRRPPYVVAYLDLAQGPRVLVHTGGTDPAPAGATATLGPKNDLGDLTAQVMA